LDSCSYGQKSVHMLDEYCVYKLVQISRVEIFINNSVIIFSLSQGMFLSCRLPVA